MSPACKSTISTMISSTATCQCHATCDLCLLINILVLNSLSLWFWWKAAIFFCTSLVSFLTEIALGCAVYREWHCRWINIRSSSAGYTSRANVISVFHLEILPCYSQIMLSSPPDYRPALLSNLIQGISEIVTASISRSYDCSHVR